MCIEIKNSYLKDIIILFRIRWSGTHIYSKSHYIERYTMASFFIVAQLLLSQHMRLMNTQFLFHFCMNYVSVQNIMPSCLILPVLVHGIPYKNHDVSTVAHHHFRSCHGVLTIFCLCLIQSAMYESSQIICKRKRIHNAFSEVTSLF